MGESGASEQDKNWPKGLNEREISAAAKTIDEEFSYQTHVHGRRRTAIRKLDSFNDHDHKIITRIAKKLRRNFLFSTLDENVLDTLAKDFEFVECEQGVVLIQQGEVPKDELIYYYMLIEGECQIEKNSIKVLSRFGVLGPGALFGEQPILFNNRTRAASVIISKPSILYRLNGDLIHKLFNETELKNLQDKTNEIIRAFDYLSGIQTGVGGTIIRTYQPSGLWLMMRWRGTVLQYVWKNVIFMLFFTLALALSFDFTNLLLRETYDYVGFHFNLTAFAQFWNTLLPMTSFVVTFFLAQAYQFWSKFYWRTRKIQARFNDISLLVASTMVRDGNKVRTSSIRAAEKIYRLQFIIHVMVYAQAVRRFKCVQSPEGLSYMVSLNTLTEDEFDAFIQARSNNLSCPNIATSWLATCINEAINDGDLNMTIAHTQVMLHNLSGLRGTYAGLFDMYVGLFSELCIVAF